MSFLLKKRFLKNFGYTLLTALICLIIFTALFYKNTGRLPSLYNFQGIGEEWEMDRVRYRIGLGCSYKQLVGEFGEPLRVEKVDRVSKQRVNFSEVEEVGLAGVYHVEYPSMIVENGFILFEFEKGSLKGILRMSRHD